MLRDLKKTLEKWKAHPLRMPLIVRGARQVGKTFVIKAFGKEAFKNSLEINFETDPKYQDCFIGSLEPSVIIRQIELMTYQKCIPGETLLFLDEIQQCPRALQSLRYFKEKLPDLHVIAAGSLLEFVLHDEEFSFPVGRVQFAKLYPLSFEEYLDACGDSALRAALSTFDCLRAPPAALHTHLLNRIQEYFIVGGMPAAVVAFLKTSSFLEVQYVQQALLSTFVSDFGKYAKKSQHRHLKKIFSDAPRLLGKHIKYSNIDPELPNPARDMKQAIELLQRAGLIHLLFATTAGMLPLLSGLKESIFKWLFLDIGLVEQALGLEPQSPNLMTGALAEQYVGQELLAMSDPLLDTQLFFWCREKGSAEVDYLFPHRGIVYPIEVKAGKSGKLKSMHLFVEEKRVPFGIRICREPLNWHKGVLSVPFYLTAHLPRLIDHVFQFDSGDSCK